jgi:hypothetical protein
VIQAICSLALRKFDCIENSLSTNSYLNPAPNGVVIPTSNPLTGYQ